MDYIQIVTVIMAIIIALNLFALLRRREISVARFLSWVLLWGIVVFLVSYPGLTDDFADLVGIDRGTDAAFFGAIVLIFYVLLKIFTRLERIEKNITKIVREIALRESEDDPKGK